MNQDSEDGLTKRQKSKRSKVLEVSSDTDEEAPEYTPAREYFGDPWKSKADVGNSFYPSSLPKKTEICLVTRLNRSKKVTHHVLIPASFAT